MGVFEAVVVFVIVWWLIFLPILSMGSESQLEAGSVEPGTERGAPTRPRLAPKAIAATLGAGLVTTVLYIAFAMGWISLYPPAV